MQPLVRHVRAPNPSAMTGSGTNSWILGKGEVAVIDPGPDDPTHLDALLATLDPAEHVVAILVTHAHLDHSALAPRLAAKTGAPVLAFGPAGQGRSALMQRLAAEGLEDGGEGIDRAFHPDRRLADRELLDVGPLEIEAIHTPGHMSGHLCFACKGLLFSGDHAMGWASSLVSPPEGDMGAYITSLQRLADRSWSRMLPGHGDPVDSPADRLRELIAHRRHRETQILTELARAPGTAAELAARIYLDTPSALLPAATRNVLAHLIDMSERNIVTPDSTIASHSQFRLT